MTPALYEVYRRNRRSDPYMGARHALYLARRTIAGHAYDWTGYFDGSADLGTFDGCEVTAEVSYIPEPADLDFIGSFTDDPEDAVPNPAYERGSYKYFRPERSLEDRVADYSRYHGMARSVARSYALGAIHEDARIATTLAPYSVTVHATIGGATGSDSIGFDASDDDDVLMMAEEVMAEHGLIEEATRAAWESLARKLKLDARLYEEVPAR